MVFCEIRYFKEKGSFPLPKEASGYRGLPSFKGFVEIELLPTKKLPNFYKIQFKHNFLGKLFV